TGRDFSCGSAGFDRGCALTGKARWVILARFRRPCAVQSRPFFARKSMSADLVEPKVAAPPHTPSLPPFPQTLGHPRPLCLLFTTEFRERFAFYGMRWALALYIVAEFYRGNPAGEAPASELYGAYLALVYAAAIFGGYVADRLIGYQRSILVGAAFMSAGLFMIMVPSQPMLKLGLA